jgi:uncharacterized protein (DUF952 family)
MDPILHISTAAAWQRATDEGVYRGDTLASEGFIHCSTPRQAVRVANARFRGRSGLVLLRIDPGKLRPELRYEEGEPGELYPLIYGPLNLDAVQGVYPFEPIAGGEFDLPAAVTE